MESDHITAIRGGSHTDFVMSNREEDLQPAKKSKIVFKRYGDQYFLSEVWIVGKKTYIKCLETSAEKQTRLANVSTVPQDVDLALVEAKR